MLCGVKRGVYIPCDLSPHTFFSSLCAASHCIDRYLRAVRSVGYYLITKIVWVKVQNALKGHLTSLESLPMKVVCGIEHSLDFVINLAGSKEIVPLSQVGFNQSNALVGDGDHFGQRPPPG